MFVTQLPKLIALLEIFNF